jgi:hypothetical protein
VPFAYSPSFGWLGGVPLVDVGDVVYASDGTNVLAVDPDGSTRWNRPLGRPVAIGRGGILYAVTASGVEAVGPDGTVSWTHPWTTAGAHWWPPITMGIDGNLVGDQSSSVLTALHPDGSVGWSVSLWSSSPDAGAGGIVSYAIGPAGTIYVATSDPNDFVSSANHVSALSPAGVVQWSLDSIERNQPSPGDAMVASDGTVYIPASGGTRVFGADGMPRPSLATVGVLASGAEGDVFIRTDRLVHVRADGTTAWSVEIGLQGGGLVVVNDAVYVPAACNGQVSCTPYLSAFDMGGQPLWTLGGVNPQVVVVGERIVYALEIDMRDQHERLVAIGD